MASVASTSVIASDASISIVPLGAGQDVGRSCLLVTIGGKRVLCDVGMHMGFEDARRFPDFSVISTGNLTEIIDCVIISHFHLDHCGGLVYLTEQVGYDGPVYMTHPTKAIVPILLEDYRKISTAKGATNFFTSDMIAACMKKVRVVALHEQVAVDPELTIMPYYAGHVLGAAMFLIRVGTQSVLYTGDFNSTPDRHLGAAWVDLCRPTVLITESTYATTVRDSKRAREADFLRKVHECVREGGKVLVPVFALGRAQELCILVDQYWQRMGLRHVPIYFSAGLTVKANLYYKLFLSWTNEKIKTQFTRHGYNAFDFKHILEWDNAFINDPGPCVLFSSPGMLHVGTSLTVFKKWAHSEKNLVIMPGFCVKGTVGAKLLAGERDNLEVDRNTIINVKMQVKSLSFSAHADASGILQLMRHCEPGAVVLVHGEAAKQEVLKERIINSFGIPCYNPANGTLLEFSAPHALSVALSPDMIAATNPAKRRRRFSACANDNAAAADDAELAASPAGPESKLQRTLTGGSIVPAHAVAGMLLGRLGDESSLRLLGAEEAARELGYEPQTIMFATEVPLAASLTDDATAMATAQGMLDVHLAGWGEDVVRAETTELRVASVSIRLAHEHAGRVWRLRWDYYDDDVARAAISALQLAVPTDAAASAAAEPMCVEP